MFFIGRPPAACAADCRSQQEAVNVMPALLFAVLHDAAGFKRSEKLVALKQWPEAFDNLRICWSAPNKDENCGVCGKCVLSLLQLKRRGISAPKSFPREIDEETLCSIRALDFESVPLFEGFLESLQPGELSPELVRGIRQCVKNDARKRSEYRWSNVGQRIRRFPIVAISLMNDPRETFAILSCYRNFQEPFNGRLFAS